MKLEWKQTTIVLVLGVALGVVGTLRFLPAGTHHGQWKNPEGFHNRLMNRFTSKLQLTPDQQQKISSILEQTHSKMTAMREEIGPKFREIKNSARASIREILTAEQQKKFDVMNAEKDRRFKRRHSKMRP